MTTQEATSPSGRSERFWLAVILFLGLGLRLTLMSLPGYAVDLSFFTDWAYDLVRFPTEEFYALTSPFCDYLPGYLYLLGATGWVKTALSGSGPFLVQDFEPWIKAGPIIADLILGTIVYVLCRRYVGVKRSLAGAGMVVLNPGIIFVGSVWGQVESIAIVFYMLSLLALVTGSPALSAVWAAAGLVTKPQYAIFLLPVGAAYLRSEFLASLAARRSGTGPIQFDRVVRRIIAPVAVLIGTSQLLLLPFSMSLWPAPGVEWNLFSKVADAGIDSFTSSGAFNLWGTHIAGIRKPDSAVGWLTWTLQTWGFTLLSGVAMISLMLVWRRSNSITPVLWGAFLLAFGLFEVLTRMHERYLFAAVPLIAALAAIRLWALPFYASVSGLYFVNLWYIWSHSLNLFAMPRLIAWSSYFSVLVFAAAIVVALVLAVREPPSFAGGSTLWEYAPNPGKKASILSLPLRKFLTLSGRVRAGGVVALVVLLAAAGWTGGLSHGWGGSQAGNTPRTVMVRGYASWQDTGIRVSAGERLSISARGLWKHQFDGELYGPMGNGYIDPKAILPVAPVGALVGKIGNSAPFEIGSSADIQAAADGTLRLVMNDWPNEFANNRGRLRVEIIREDAPETQPR